MTAPPQSRRARPAKEPLSREAVVAAGLAILRAEGLSAVTMRRVAAALDTGPASLYVYVRNAEELHRELFDAVAGLVELPVVDPHRWREQLSQLLLDEIRILTDHPGIARVAIGHIPLGPNALRASELMMALLAAGGVADQAAAWALDLFGLYVSAVAFENSVYGDSGFTDKDFPVLAEHLLAVFSGLDAARFPRLRTMGPLLTAGSGDDRERFGIEVMINGLLATTISEG